MAIKAASISEFLESIPSERKQAMTMLRKAIQQNLPKGFTEAMSYGMIGYVVPHSLYPDGYHCDPKLPLPFLAIASQKNFIAIYHMGMYADPELLKWFTEEFTKRAKAKLDMGEGLGSWPICPGRPQLRGPSLGVIFLSTGSLPCSPF